MTIQIQKFMEHQPAAKSGSSMGGRRFVVPKGLHENSPAFQCRVSAAKSKSPEGTADLRGNQPSLRGLRGITRSLALRCRAIFGRSRGRAGLPAQSTLFVWIAVAG